MRRLFYKGLLADKISINGTDAHHLMHVMRAKAGQQVTVVDDEGSVALMEMTAFTPESVELILKERLEGNTESPLELTLVQCILKADKMDWIVQKAVELGANTIQPLASKNCVVQYDRKKANQRQERWQKIADEAAKQCGRTRLLKVEPIRTIKEFLSSANFSEEKPLYFCYENEEQQKLKEALKASQADNASVLIGPEGGFTLEEAEAIEHSGGQSVTLGPRILRAETAAIASISVVQYELGDLG